MSLENVEIVRRAIEHYNDAGELPRGLIDPGTTGQPLDQVFRVRDGRVTVGLRW